MFESDFFDEFTEAQRQAKRFIAHHSIREAIHYYTNYTLSSMVTSSADGLAELEMHWDDMEAYVNELIKILEGCEDYSLCHKLKVKFEQFSGEFIKIAEHMQHNK